MKKKNTLAILLILFAVAGSMAELLGWLLPTISWPFTVSRDMRVLSLPAEVAPWLAVDDRFHWFGWLCMLVMAVVGVYFLLRSRDSLRLPPMIAKRWQRFRSLKRGYWSLLILCGIVGLAAMDQCLVGKRALVVSYEGRWYFPAFTRNVIPGATFGQIGNAAHAETDYRKLKTMEGTPGGPDFVILPPIPYAPTGDAVPFPTEALQLKGKTVMESTGQFLYNGQASRLYADGKTHLRIRYRRGLPDGMVQGWDPDGKEVYSARYNEGKLTEEYYTGKGKVAEFLALTPADKISRVYYHPAPPLTGGHILGTNSQGADIMAYLYGGLQVNIKAALIYIPIVYSIGLTLGMFMGYFGGKADLLTQRIIEVVSQLPFLFVVMILADFVPLQMRGMFLILVLLALFGWMHITYLVRTATMKEKTREYVDAARVMGAGPLHILARHIFPNLTGIIVTLLPFSIAAVVLSLASLDYMGFGLPDTYASWGRLLNDGLSKLSSPWVVSSAFCALVITLMLVTFIGEAVREAVDPRRHTYYE
ncbi:MAG: ABC transporter permease subunit [Akkermansiaceae bacterium]|nr:ABC transporter permease subunit [Akkermansiaceae bacterium]